MKISIITPSLNQGRFITDAIESVANQSYFDKEHLIIDAQSTDTTLEVIQRYTHLPHLKWVSEPDKGQSDAINKGFKAATGDVVAWLNADDYYLPHTLSKVTEIFEKNPDIDVLYGDAMFVDQNKHFLRYKRDHPFDYKILLYYGCFISTTSTFFRRRIIDSSHFLDITYKSTMDYEYFVRLANKGYKFEYAPEIFGVFRWHGNNVSLDHQKARAEAQRVLDSYGFKFTNSTTLQSMAHRIASFLYRGKRRLLRLALNIKALNEIRLIR